MATPKKNGNSSASAAKKKTTTATAAKKKTVATATKKTNASTARKTSSTRKPASASSRKPAKKSHKGLFIGLAAGAAVLIAGIITALALLVPGKEWTEVSLKEDVKINVTKISEVEKKYGKADESEAYHMSGKNVDIKTWHNVKNGEYVDMVVSSETGTVYSKDFITKEEAKDLEDEMDALDLDEDYANFKENDTIKGDLYGKGHIKINSKKWTLSDYQSIKTSDYQTEINLDDIETDDFHLELDDQGITFGEAVEEFGEPAYYMINESDGQKTIIAVWGNTNGDALDSTVSISFEGNSDDDQDNYHASYKNQTGLK